MAISQQVFALMLLVFAGCADDMPVTARYVPEDCPPTATAAEAEPEPDAELVPDVEDDDSGGTPETVIELDPPPETRSDLVDLNRADATELETLPGVGPALASRIIEYRSKRYFDEIDELQRVRGIGPAKFEKLRELVTVSDVQKRTP